MNIDNRVHTGHVQHMVRLAKQSDKLRQLSNEVANAFVPLEHEKQSQLRQMLRELIRQTENEQDRLFFMVINKISEANESAETAVEEA